MRPSKSNCCMIAHNISAATEPAQPTSRHTCLAVSKYANIVAIHDTGHHRLHIRKDSLLAAPRRVHSIIAIGAALGFCRCCPAMPGPYTDTIHLHICVFDLLYCFCDCNKFFGIIFEFMMLHKAHCRYSMDARERFADALDIAQCVPACFL